MDLVLICHPSVPGHDHAAIGYALDCGASIVIPQVETVEQAKHVLSAAKYGTKQNGSRSAPLFRLIPFLTDTPYDPNSDIHKCVNNQAAVMIQIESAEGVRNLDAILTECPDIDVVWLGSLDARVSMNLPANMGGQDEPEWLKIKKLFFETIDRHDKPYAGFAFTSPLYGSPEAIKEAAKRMSLISMSADVMHLGAMAMDLQQARELLGPVGQKDGTNGTNGKGAENGENGKSAE